MIRRLAPVAVGFLLGVVLTLIAVSETQAGSHNCRPAWKCLPPTAVPSVVTTLLPSDLVTVPPTAAPTVTPAPTVAPTASSGTYTFVDEFNGTSIDPVWIRHYSCCGTLAGYDPALAVEGGGNLSITADNRSGSWYSYLLDTKTTFTQQYGYFEARIKVPKFKGSWPAFWGYHDATNYEIDTMEVCANPVGQNGGNDATLLHQYVHWGGGGQQGVNTQAVDLSLDYHVFAHEWRAGFVQFYLDGVPTWRFTDASHVPNVALPLIINLGVGGSWCSAPDPAGADATMLVDWIRVRP